MLKRNEGGRRIQLDVREVNNFIFSIITVNYNGGKTIEETIQSVIQQNGSAFEYLIIDGGSNDNSLDIIKKYEDKIDYWISKPDKGIFDAMNKGIALAKGELICMLNSDDKFAPNVLELVEKVVKKNPNSQVFYGDASFFLRTPSFKEMNLFCPGVLPKKSWFFTPVSHQSLFLRRQIHKKYGGYDLSFTIAADQDYITMLQNKEVNFTYIHEVLTFCDLSGISNTKGWYQGRFEILKLCIKRGRLLSVPLILAEIIKRFVFSFFKNE